MNFIIENYRQDGDELDKKQLKQAVMEVSSNISKKWKKAHGKMDVFNKLSWLDKSDFELKTSRIVLVKPNVSHLPGRPEKSFSESSDRTKKRKIRELLKEDTEQLAYAAQVSLYSSGNRKASRQIKNLTSSSSTPSSSKPSGCTNARSLTPDEALALWLDCKLTKASYCLLREQANHVGHNLYPPYYKIQQSKKSCCIPEQTEISETRAEVSLQALLDATARRLCEVQYAVLQPLVEAGNNEFILYSKWGCDGSGGHSKYKQKFTSDASSNDEYLFMFTVVPINLRLSNNIHTYAWKNNVPGSTRFCRPLKFMYLKETTSLIVSETDSVKENIKKLLPTTFIVNGTEISIMHDLVLTMVDGKVCNALTNTKSSQTCFICSATPKILKNPNAMLPPDRVENYSYGLSTLHAWIRTFEFLLHLSYRLDIKKKIVRDAEDKQMLALKKAEIQNQFKNQLGLIVDQPKQGFGNTNDGNTARRFFKHYSVSATITGLDETIIRRFGIILQVLSSGYEIDIPKFEKYVSDTKIQYVDRYSWYEMTPTVHKILEHSSLIIQHHLVPIGQLSEEAQEARNKDCRRFREHHTRKTSRVDTNTDLLTMLLVSSDPIIASYRKPIKKRSDSMTPELLSLLSVTATAANCNDQLSTLAISASDTDSDSDFGSDSGSDSGESET